jgi:hypothetical protein
MKEELITELHENWFMSRCTQNALRIAFVAVIARTSAQEAAAWSLAKTLQITLFCQLWCDFDYVFPFVAADFA